jgi:lipid A 3-O-deacylase
MKTKNLKFFFALVLITFASFLSANAEEKKNNVSEHEVNFFGGMFDFSDEGQRAALFGIQHQNETLERETFLGKLSPITGAFVTENSAAYVYTGVEWNFDLGGINFTPSFTPGLYSEGDGKDLGHVIEFKSELQASFNISKDTSLGMSYNHISNASIGDKNPGANSYMVNFLKKF